MKRRYLILAGILAVALITAGCGSKKEENKEETEAQITVAPVEETNTETKDDGLVEMQQNTEEDIPNVMGVKSATSSEIIFVNKTGADVARLYVRPNTDDDEEWGDDLIQGAFTFKNQEKALYYLEKSASGSTVTSYDIRIIYTDEDRSECYFRKIPLQNISQITLCMDGTGEDSIPYATYLTGASRQETSTLQEVKQRLGLADTDSDDDSDDQDQTDTQDPTQAPEEPAQTDPTQAPADDQDPGDSPSAGASVAEQYIGKSLGELTAAIGEASGSDYEDEPETGETGYHYYDSFTVSTTVDEAGNEVVAGVW